MVIITAGLMSGLNGNRLKCLLVLMIVEVRVQLQLKGCKLDTYIFLGGSSSSSRTQTCRNSL